MHDAFHLCLHIVSDFALAKSVAVGINILKQVQRFLRRLGIFACIALLKVSASIKNFLAHSITFLQIVELFRHFCDAAHSYFNIQSSYNQFCILDYLSIGTVQVFDWNLVPTSPEMQLFIATFFKHFSSLVQGLHQIFKTNNLHWTGMLQTILHSKFHSDWAYSGLQKGILH